MSGSRVPPPSIAWAPSPYPRRSTTPIKGTTVAVATSNRDACRMIPVLRVRSGHDSGVSTSDTSGIPKASHNWTNRAALSSVRSE